MARMRSFRAPIAREGVTTGDGRHIIVGALDLPRRPVSVTASPNGGHEGAVPVGVFRTFERETHEDGTTTIWSDGLLDVESDLGEEIERQLGLGIPWGVSIVMGYSQGYIDESDVVTWFVTHATIRNATIVTTAAFEDTENIVLGEWVDTEDVNDFASAVAFAFGGAVRAPADRPDGSWFSDPQLDGPTRLVVEDSGRIYGHIAQWGVCHLDSAGRCITAPHSATGYRHFTTGVVETTTGLVETGTLTFVSGHAPKRRGGRRLTAAQARAHYDDLGTAYADVAVGEDAHGIWVAGALRDGVTDEERRVIMAHPLSGDWRATGGSSELIAVMSVNVQGFTVGASGFSDESYLRFASEQTRLSYAEENGRMVAITGSFAPTGTDTDCAPCDALESDARDIEAFALSLGMM